MSKTSLTVLSKRYLEKLGYVVEKVEYWNPFAHKRIDLLGVGDLLALNGEEMLLVQVTSRSNISSRRKKALESEKLKLWLAAGGKFILHGIDKVANDTRWRITEYELNICLVEKAEKKYGKDEVVPYVECFCPKCTKKHCDIIGPSKP